MLLRRFPSQIWMVVLAGLILPAPVHGAPPSPAASPPAPVSAPPAAAGAPAAPALAAPAAPAPAAGPLPGAAATTEAGQAPEIPLTPKQAVKLALQQNLALQQARLDPALSDGRERAAEAAFAPQLTARTEIAGDPGSISASRAGLSPTSTTDLQGYVGVSKPLRYGTTLEAGLTSSALYGGGSRGGLDPAYQAGLNLTARQPLLQGRSREINEAPLLEARLSREIAEASLERQAELVAAEVNKTYWDLRAALAKVKIDTLAVGLAEQTLDETTTLIAAGKLAASERHSAAYSLQQLRRALALAQQNVANVRDRMARLIGLSPPDSQDTPAIVPVSNPRRTPPKRVLADLFQQAQRSRSDYRLLVQQIRQEELSARIAEHELLPRLDLVAGLGLSGLSGSPAGDDEVARSRGESYWASYGMDSPTWSAGLTLSLPLDNTAAAVASELAGVRVKRAQAQERQATQELALELNLAWRAVESAREQLRLTEEAAVLAERKLETETANYKAGKITAHVLATVQAEAVTERLGKEQALAELARALVDLKVAAGILLFELKLRPDGTEIP
ncbi:MAG: TolC family protein [Myxococcota bacterium]|nr:TolC family protein [Myxococcota bacterium]